MNTLIEAFDSILLQKLYVGSIPAITIRHYLDIKYNNSTFDYYLYKSGPGKDPHVSWPQIGILDKNIDIRRLQEMLSGNLLAYRKSGVNYVVKHPNCVPLKPGEAFQVFHPVKSI